MSTPGAATSTAEEELENAAGWSSCVVAAAVRTCGSSAGNESGLPVVVRSFPAAATVIVPRPNASTIASSMKKLWSGPPRLRLIKPRPASDACVIPWITVVSSIASDGLASKARRTACG